MFLAKQSRELFYLAKQAKQIIHFLFLAKQSRQSRFLFLLFFTKAKQKKQIFFSFCFYRTKVGKVNTPFIVKGKVETVDKYLSCIQKSKVSTLPTLLEKSKINSLICLAKAIKKISTLRTKTIFKNLYFALLKIKKNKTILCLLCFAKKKRKNRYQFCLLCLVKTKK